MKKKWILLIGGIIIIGALVFIGSQVAQQRAQAQEPVEGEIVTVFIGELSASATASGQVKPQREATLSADSPSRVEITNVREGDLVESGDLLLQLDTTRLALNVATAEENLRLKQATLEGILEPANAIDIASAEAAVTSAQANLDDFLSGPTAAELATYEANLRSSEASLLSASAGLSTAQDAVKESQIRAAEAALAAAQMQLKSAQEANEEDTNEQTHQVLLSANQAVIEAQAQLNNLLDGPDTAAAQSNVSAAAARLDSAQANFNIQSNNVTEAQIAGAQAQLAQAEASLASLLEGPSADDIAIAEAEVEQARLNLADAQDTLTEAAITAPFDGVVTAVNFEEGEIASGPVIELIDTNRLEVILEVDEVDVGSLSLGQPASLSFETWPDTEIPSEIVRIAPTAVTQPGSSLVIYEVHLSLNATELPVRVGMTANANLITAEIDDVLLVPNQAINADRERGTYTVNLLVGEGMEEVPVTIGLRDNQFTEITSGLNAGDELQVGNAAPIGNIFGPGPGGN